jgi:hypothetical protein
MPTLGEFARRVRRFGIRLKHTPTLGEGPRGSVRFYYLQRTNGGPLVVIPDMRNDERLKHEVVVAWCRVLDIPLDEFGLDEKA